MYLAASTRSQVATAQHGDHGFPKCGILCPDIRDPIAVPFHHFKKYAIRQSFAVFLLLNPLFFPEFLASNDKENGCIWRPGRPGLIRGGDPVAPPTGDRPLSPRPGRHVPPFPLSFEPKNLGKKLEWLSCCHIFLKWWNGTVIGSRMSGQRMRHLGNP